MKKKKKKKKRNTAQRTTRPIAGLRALRYAIARRWSFVFLPALHAEKKERKKRKKKKKRRGKREIAGGVHPRPRAALFSSTLSPLFLSISYSEEKEKRKEGGGERRRREGHKVEGRNRRCTVSA